MYPLTLFSSIAKVFIAACILSKLVAFHTKSTEKPCVQSIGTPSFRLSSRQISSETSVLVSSICESSGERTVWDFDDSSYSFPHLFTPVAPTLIQRL